MTAPLPVGTLVTVSARGDSPAYVGRVVGYDLGDTKYEIGARYGGWGRWLFMDGGSWAFPDQVQQVTDPHVLVVTAAPDDPDVIDYEVECPGVTDECREWRACTVINCTLIGEYEFIVAGRLAHGKRHKYINGTWMTSTDNCYIVGHDRLPDAAASLFPPGHPVVHDVGDGTELFLFAAEPGRDI